MSTSAKVAGLCLVALASFYLLTEHLQHTLGALPYAVLVLCPVLHLVMHRGHAHHRGPPPAEGDVHAPR